MIAAKNADSNTENQELKKTLIAWLSALPFHTYHTYLGGC